jgi:hypothetical protein
MNQKASTFAKIVKEHTPACSELLLTQAAGHLHSLFFGSFPQQRSNLEVSALQIF